jgi:hypothetical protein
MKSTADLLRSYRSILEDLDRDDYEPAPGQDEDESEQADEGIFDDNSFNDSDPTEGLAQALANVTDDDVQIFRDAINNYLRTNSLDLVPTDGLVDNKGNI